MTTVSFLLHSVLLISSSRNFHVPTHTVAFKLQEFTLPRDKQNNTMQQRNVLLILQTMNM